MWVIVLAFAKAYWKPLAVIAVLASLVAYHRIAVAWAHHEGVIDGKAAIQTQLDAAQVQNAQLHATLTKLRAEVTDANQRVDAMTVKAQAAQQASAKALADEQAKAKVWQAQSVKLMAIIARPKATDAQVCNRADALLRSLQ